MASYPTSGSATIGMDVVRYAGDTTALTASASTSSASSAAPIQPADASLVSLALAETGFLDSLVPADRSGSALEPFPWLLRMPSPSQPG
jgi:hypothetical protein